MIRKPSTSEIRATALQSWQSSRPIELWLLLLFLVTLMGILSGGRLHSLPSIRMMVQSHALERDPYDLNSDNSLAESQGRIEVGM